jgi:hypothetical protein
MIQENQHSATEAFTDVSLQKMLVHNDPIDPPKFEESE